MKRLIYLLAFGMLATSCVSSQKYGTYVEQKIKAEPLQEVAQKDWLIVNTPVTEQKGSNYTKVIYSFIPALVYWGWNSTIACELDPQTTAAYVKRGIYEAADKLDLQNRLAGRQLVIDIERLPGQFLYENKGNTIFLIFAHVTTGEEAISPRPTNLMVRYTLLEDGAVVASGEGLVKNEEQRLRNVWKSTKKFTWLYLDQFEKEANRMGSESVKDILQQLEG